MPLIITNVYCVRRGVLESSLVRTFAKMITSLSLRRVISFPTSHVYTMVTTHVCIQFIFWHFCVNSAMLHCYYCYHIQPTSDILETHDQAHEYLDLEPLSLGQLHLIHHTDMPDHDTSLVEYSQISHNPMLNLKNEVEPTSGEKQYAVAGRQKLIVIFISKQLP